MDFIGMLTVFCIVNLSKCENAQWFQVYYISPVSGDYVNKSSELLATPRGSISWRPAGRWIPFIYAEQSQ